MLANAGLTPLVVALAIGVPSALLYGVELGVIIANFGHFRSSFFVLVIVRGICSLVNYVCSCFAHRFGRIGLFLPIYLSLPRLVLALLSFVVYYAFHVENLLTALLLLNRVTSLLMPMNYEKFWHRSLPFFLAVSFILPLPFTAPIFGFDMFIHVQLDNVTFTLDDHKTENEINSSELAAWSAILFGVICLLLNLATLFAYKLRRCQNAGLQNNANSKVERKMTIYTVFTFFGQLIFAIFMKWLNISLEMDDLLFLANINQYPWVSDLATVAIPAWLLVWASSKVREILAEKFNKLTSRFKKQKSGSIQLRVLSPFSMEILKEELGQQPFSLCIDASNHGEKKLVPIVIRFFNGKLGLRTRLLDMTSLPGETADQLFDWIYDFCTITNSFTHTLDYPIKSGQPDVREMAPISIMEQFRAKIEEVVQLAEQICPEIAQLDELFDEVSAVNQTLAGIPEEFWLKSAEDKWKGIFAADGAIEGYKNLYRVVSAAFSIPTSNAFVERVFFTGKQSMDQRNKFIGS
ncbi:hypothetical protein niasHT_016943 [Heterodera trifolii]|uniref:Serpentine receptor class gamma n=1 Tax=Heterodera trifolii TaxID=157864 RepID=A0ABD2LB85_9BILA